MEQIIFPWHLRPVFILTSSPKIRSLFSGVEFFDNDGPPSDRKESDEEEKFLLRGLLRPIIISTNTLAAVSTSSQGAWLMLDETHKHLAKRQCSMAIRGIMKISRCMPFIFHVANVSQNPAHLPKHMIFVYPSNELKRIAHFQGTNPNLRGFPTIYQNKGDYALSCE